MTSFECEGDIAGRNVILWRIQGCLDLVVVRVGIHRDVYLYDKTAPLTATSGQHTDICVDNLQETT